MKLKSLKVFQSIKVGAEEVLFLKGEDYDMELKDQLVRIVSKKSKAVTYTPITNIPWFTIDETPVVAKKKPPRRMDAAVDAALESLKKETPKKKPVKKVNKTKN